MRSSLLLLSVSVGVAAGFVGACTGEDAVLTATPASDGGANTEEVGQDAADRACDPTKDFAPAVPVTGLGVPGYIASGATFSPDERVVYLTQFTVTDGASPYVTNVYTASRASTVVGFDAPRFMDELGGKGRDESPTVTADGQGLYFVRDNVVFEKNKDFPAVDPPAIPLAGPINDAHSYTPYVLPDGRALYFSRPSSTDVNRYELYRVAKGATGYADLRPVAGLGANATTNDRSPVVTADELTIYFARQPAGAPSADIYLATRQDTSAPFGDARVVASLSTTARHEIPSFISADGCRLYFTSLGGSLTGDTIFVATKPK